jgi:hypothetical protein
VTIVDRVYATSQIVQVRFIKEDGAYHRTTIEPGVSVDDQIAAVNAHLAKMKCKPVEIGGIDRIREFVAAAHTPDVVEQWLKAKRRA